MSTAGPNKTCLIYIHRHVNHEEFPTPIHIAHHAKTIGLIGDIVTVTNIRLLLHTLFAHILDHHRDGRNATETVCLHKVLVAFKNLGSYLIANEDVVLLDATKHFTYTTNQIFDTGLHDHRSCLGVGRRRLRSQKLNLNLIKGRLLCNILPTFIGLETALPDEFSL